MRELTTKKDKMMLSKIAEAMMKNQLEEILLENPKALEGKSSNEIKEMVFREVYAWAYNPKTEFRFIIDHTKSLLKYARSNLKIGETELAAFFYATYFEHKINYLIHLAGVKRDLSKASIKNIIRKLSLEEKATWGLEVMGLSPINSKHKNIIKIIGEIRNRYVHFKWNPIDEISNENDKKELAKAESTVKYLRNFEEKYIFLSKRKTAMKAIKKR